MDKKWKNKSGDHGDLNSVVGGDPIFSQTK